MGTIFCKHYNGVQHDKCEAGVTYLDITLGMGTPECSRPCVVGARRNYNPLGATCDKCEMPTAEELAAKEERDRKSMEGMKKARAAIVAYLGGPWKEGMPAKSGYITCPVCEAASGLRFSRAGYNGHIHAACSTEGCVAWME